MTIGKEYATVLRLMIRAGDCAIGVAWLWSALIHMGNPFIFLESVLGYQLANGMAAAAIATLMMSTSLVLGLFLIIGAFAQGARLLSIGFFCAFLVAQVSVLARGIDAACGCFGSNSSAIGFWTLLTTAFFLSLSICLFLADQIVLRSFGGQNLATGPKTGEHVHE